MKKKSCNIIVPQGTTQGKHPLQLSLPLDPPQNREGIPFKKRQKPQISSIPGISPKERDRYRVVLKNEILGDRLTLDEALKLAKEGES